MTLTITNSWHDGRPQHGVGTCADGVDEELHALQRAVAEARRHSWNDPDPIEHELENFLAALSRSSTASPDRFIPPVQHSRRHNAWREDAS